jgi:hypothetical protein
LWVLIQGFEGGIGIFKRGGPLKFTGARLFNHQTSKISPNLFYVTISLQAF